MIQRAECRRAAWLCLGTAFFLGGCRSQPERTPAAKPAPKPGVAAAVPEAASGVLEITVGGFRNREGQVKVAVYTAREGFPSDPTKAYLTDERPLAGDSVAFRFERVPYGTYAVSVLHDENRNGRFSFEARRHAERGHPIEQVGQRLWAMMPFLEARQVGS